jgi:hypothetical protein
MRFPRSTKAEQETLYRYDEEERILRMWTANPAVARRWRRLGYDVRDLGHYPDRTTRSWQATGPVDALRLRPVRDGQVVRRPPPAHAFKAEARGDAQVAVAAETARVDSGAEVASSSTEPVAPAGHGEPGSPRADSRASADSAAVSPTP